MPNNKTKHKAYIKASFSAMRPYHFAKNFLLFIPFLVGHHYFNLISLKNNLVGFLAFCLLASSAYVINDLVDLEKDKQHSRKQKRPFASGELPLNVGFTLAPCLLLIAFVISFYLPLCFLLSAISYYSLTLLYSFFIKQKKWLDVALLAILYSLRVFAGMALVENGYSLWLIIFVLFLFFSLALLKRYAELYNAQLENKTSIIGRAYQLVDRGKLIFLGQTSTYLAILTFIFYIYSKKVLFLYKSPLLLWLICPCLFVWLKRLWHFAQQGKIYDDPVVFTVTDKFSWAIVILIAVISLFAAWITV
ncbi:MAG: UbiA family prenyltransferase [Rickettsiella sp.]|nr:UbiA family prenyltransferase [Rickettsiella sp.]